MSNILNGLYNLLNFIEENWGIITAIVVLAISVGKKVTIFFNKSRDEQLAIAKVQISETMLKWVSMAERDWIEWQQAGKIKRSQVIDLIFEKYPILSKVTNQEEIITFLDESINEALKTMRKIFEENAERDVNEEFIEATVDSEVTFDC